LKFVNMSLIKPHFSNLSLVKNEFAPTFLNVSLIMISEVKLPQSQTIEVCCQI
jgi:hypothetical protein